MKRFPEEPERLPEELLRLAEQQTEPEPARIGSIIPEVLKSHGMVIPTVYNGTQYRIRLEARWAVFFDVLDLHYDYEPEGFDFNGLRYLPDFWFPDLECYVEIKPATRTDIESRKAECLAGYADRSVYVFETPIVGVPKDSEFLCGMDWIPTASKCFSDGYWDEGYHWCECTTCGKFGIEYGGRSDRVCRHDDGDRGHNTHSPRLMTAYRTARTARFWK